MKYAIIGLGSRGKNYGTHIHNRKGEIVSVCDLSEPKVNRVKTAWNVPESACFTDENAFFAQGKVADVMIIATQDKDHYGHVLRALELGYDILVEKPLSPDIAQCVEMEKRARELGRKVLVCHVLRYAPYYRKIRELIATGVIGEVQEIRHSENISYWHFAHSYVRGNWRKQEETSPLLLAKCCHDLDLIYWFSGSKCKSLSSYGGLTYFKPEHAPEGAAGNCFDCKLRETCPYDAEYQYIGRKRALGRTHKKFPWGNYAFCVSSKKQDVLHALKNDPKGKQYARCVWHSDNDVADCQTLMMEMENGIKCQMTVSAFNEKNYRHTEIRGTKGEIVADDRRSVMTLWLFDKKPKKIRTNFISLLRGHHGGDQGIINAVLNLDKVEPGYHEYTWIADTLESHRIVTAAERSRKEGGRKVEMSEIEDRA